MTQTPLLLPGDLVLVFLSVTRPGIRFLWLFCSGGTPIHHLASGNPGTPFRHAQTERLPNLCLITQQVCGEVRTYMVSHPQWVEMQAQPYVTNIGPGCCEQLHGRASWRPWSTLALQHEPDFPSPSSRPAKPLCYVGTSPSFLSRGKSRKGWPTALDLPAHDEYRWGREEHMGSQKVSLTCHSNFCNSQRCSKQHAVDLILKIKNESKLS